jgi:gamma-glutamyl hercynylcysteine S-oxide synthase
MGNADRVPDRGTLLGERLAAVRERTLELYAPLDHEHLVAQVSELLSPPLWDLGHIGAYEELWLARRVAGDPPLHPELDDVYDAFETPRSRRGGAPILDEASARDYLGAVRGRSLEVLEASDLDDPARPLLRDGFVFEMVAEHEAQHTETVLQALQMLPAGAYRPPRRRTTPPARPSGGSEWCEIPAGPFAMGAPA